MMKESTPNHPKRVEKVDLEKPTIKVPFTQMLAGGHKKLSLVADYMSSKSYKPRNSKKTVKKKSIV
jgi:hypothetical protein